MTLSISRLFFSGVEAGVVGLGSGEVWREASEAVGTDRVQASPGSCTENGSGLKAGWFFRCRVAMTISQSALLPG
jgi:hypothetical protein